MAHLDMAKLSSQSSKTNNDSDRDEDSWEVTAFTEDTASRMCTTWPLKSYTCTFCRREFRSAQALGGHMNVHRRDRARLHQITKKTLMKNSNLMQNPIPCTFNSLFSTYKGSTLLIPTQEFQVNGGICLLYQLRNANNPNVVNPNSLLSVAPYPTSNINPSTNFTATFPDATFPSSVTGTSYRSSLNKYHHRNSYISEGVRNSQYSTEELDLELRLGHGPTILS